MSAVQIELSRRAGVLEVPLGSAFVGGGTPTILPEDTLRQLVTAIGRNCDARTEFTVEANPNSLTPSVLAILRQAGVNRLSIGVQSFLADELQTLGRLHNPREARLAVESAHSAGLDNLSLDLIYGIPGQTLDSWRQSLQAAIDCPISHLSCYCLSFEPGTPLAADLAEGKVQAMDENLQRECYYQAIELLDQAGLKQYEISNFARPGRQCRHNLIYWHNQSYLGVGPSAVSYVAGQRLANTADLDDYLARIAAGGDAVISSESLVGRPLMAETLMLMLRLRDGVDRAAFAHRFGQDPVEAFKTPILRYFNIGMLQVTPERVFLPPQALFVADTILADILADSDR